MKKVVLVSLAAAAVLASGCDTTPHPSSSTPQPSSTPPPSSSSTPSTPQPTEQPEFDLHEYYELPESVEIIDHVANRQTLPYDGFSMAHLKELLAALATNDWQTAANVAEGVPGAFDGFASVVVADVTITKVEILSDDETMVYFDLTVTESNNDLFAVGTTPWEAKLVSDQANWAKYVLPQGHSVTTGYFGPLTSAELFCFRLASVLPKLNGTEFRDDFDFSTPYDTGQFVDAACVALSSANLPEVPYTPEYYSPEAFYNNVEKVFGMDLRDVDITQYSEYQRTQMVVPIPRGGKWVYSVITESEFDPDTKQYTITFDLYSDTICWVVGKTVQYQLSENEDGSFRLLSVDVLYDSGIDIQVGSI